MTQRIRAGAGFKNDEGKWYMVRCFQCGRENWSPMVASGKCAWCGYDANTDRDAEELAEAASAGAEAE